MQQRLLLPVQTVQVRAQITGELTSVSFKEGDDVKAGQPLVKLDPADAKVALDQANKNLKKLSDAGVKIAMGTDTGPPARSSG